MARRLKKGVIDEGDLLRVREAAVVKFDSEKSVIKVVICEGRKRHIRRLFERLGYDIIDLVRVRIGSLKLGELRGAKYRVVDRRTLIAGM